jgi:hypothetical protein
VGGALRARLLSVDCSSGPLVEPLQGVFHVNAAYEIVNQR